MSDFTPYADLRQIYAEIQFQIISDDADENAVASSTGEASASQIVQVQTNGRTQDRFNILEKNAWVLDGTGVLVPADVSGTYTGWWSNDASNDNADFSTAPKIEYSFPYPISCIGFMLNFNRQLKNCTARVVEVETYDETDQLVDSGTFTNTRGVSEFKINLPSVDISKVVFRFKNTWMPRSRVHVDGIVFGIVERYDDGDIVNFTLIHELSRDMSSLPASRFDFTIDNSSKKYNLLNPAGLYKFLNDEQYITCNLYLNGQKTNIGKYTFVESKANNDGMTATITAGSYAYLLGNGRYNIGQSGTWTFGDAIASVKTESGVDFSVDIPADILARTVGRAIPRNTLNRNALAFFAQAARCVVYFDKNNVLKCSEMTEVVETVDHFTADNTTSLNGVTVSEKINKIVLTVSDDYAGTESTYTKQEVEQGDSVRSKSYENPVVVDGSDVASWLLAVNKRRLLFTIPSRGNPTLNVADGVMVDSDFVQSREATIFKITSTYSDAYSQTVELVGEVGAL